MPNDPSPRRRSLRLPDYDYSQAGAYFITACTQKRAMLFGEVVDGDVRLNEMGTIPRSGRTIQKISCEWRLPREGGFETRPYTPGIVEIAAARLSERR